MSWASSIIVLRQDDNYKVKVPRRQIYFTNYNKPYVHDNCAKRNVIKVSREEPVLLGVSHLICLL